MNFLKSKKGSALLMTIFILNGVLLTALAASKVIISGVKMSGVQERSTKAYFAAEAGAERSAWEFRDGYSFTGGSMPGVFSETLSNNSSYSVDYASSSNIVTFTSNGDFSSMKRSVEIELDLN